MKRRRPLIVNLRNIYLTRIKQLKKHLALLAVLFAGCLLLCACGLDAVRGSGRRITESRPVSGIDRVILAGSGEVVLTQGDRESLTVETDENVMQYVTTEVSGGTLTLGTKPGTSMSPTLLRFTLAVKDLDGLNVSGSGEINVARFDTDDLKIDVSGSGSVRVETLAAQAIEVGIGGSGDVELAGQVSEQKVTIGGSGTYLSPDLRSETASVTVSGSGGATLWATDSLDARVSGSGTVRYYGDPKTSLTSTGSGTIKRVGGK